MCRRLASASNSLFKLQFAAFLGACVLYEFLMLTAPLPQGVLRRFSDNSLCAFVVRIKYRRARGI